jgi:cell division protein FtsB
MKQSINLSAFFKPLRNFFQRFHLTVFIVVIVGGLAYSVISLYNLLSDVAVIPAQTSTTGQTSFDQATIDSLTQMYASDAAPATIQLPSGRINPFGE